jgi:hypothetical protein
VNLPVHDLARSTAFYVALGGEVNAQFSDEQATSVMSSDAIGVILMTHDRYRQFTQWPIGDARCGWTPRDTLRFTKARDQLTTGVRRPDSGALSCSAREHRPGPSGSRADCRGVEGLVNIPVKARRRGPEPKGRRR